MLVTFDADHEDGDRLRAGGTCYGDSGGPNLLGGTDVVAAITITGDAVCRATNVTYRLDTVSARTFPASHLPGFVRRPSLTSPAPPDVPAPPRVVTLVLCDAQGDLLAQLPPFEAAVVVWPDAESVVQVPASATARTSPSCACSRPSSWRRSPPGGRPCSTRACSTGSSRRSTRTTVKPVLRLRNAAVARRW